MALSLIVFDCDGVLLESVDAKTRAFARIGEEYGDEARDRLVAHHVMHGGVSRYRKFEWLYREVLGRSISEAELEALNEKFVRYAYDEVMRCPMVPGAQAVLDRWHGRVPMYVASGAPHAELNQVLEVRKLSRYFGGIKGSPPGKADLLRNIVVETGARPSDSIMVGDAGTDQYAAETVRTRFYGRGEYFKHSGHPWHDDLTRLNDYLEELFVEP